MKAQGFYFWKQSPMLRLLFPFIAGIVLQRYYQLPLALLFYITAASVLVIGCFFFLPLFHRYQLKTVSGVAVFILFAAAASIITRQKDIRHQSQWLGRFYKDSTLIAATLNEPLVEKTRSMKAEATVSFCRLTDQVIASKGKIIIYFKKYKPDKQSEQLGYGSQIIFNKPLQAIRNSGNPGNFDYEQYSLFQDISHQVYLEAKDYELVPVEKKSSFIGFLYATRQKLVDIIRIYIKGEKEAGLAEALLIGYKNDLDRSLLQSYSNTGVVHIIAISGLHLGLIYWLLGILLQPLKKRIRLKWLPPLLVIAGLWLFSLLAGAQPSVLRSAVMFTCIVAGESLGRKTNIYNTLAFSAFLLLCYNPYWLWDVGFQLSYAALLSILIFMKPIYHLFYFKNKWIDTIWKLNAVTLAAQVLALPFCIYYFHQFPNYFLLTNFIAVPLSSIILIGEILLCAIAFIPAAAALTGTVLGWLITLMNACVQRIESFPFSVWDGLQVSIEQAILLMAFIAGIRYWFIQQSRMGLKAGLLALLAFTILRTISFTRAGGQQKIIVYNIPQKTAIELIDGFHYSFAGDSSLLQDNFILNFHLRPSHILHRVHPSIDQHNLAGPFITRHNKHIMWLSKPFRFKISLPRSQRPVIDLLILSNNLRVYISNFTTVLDIRQVVFDSSVPAWKKNYWKKDCDSLRIPWHDVTTKGAFAMNLR
jgi:competence protein ComEC